MFNWNEYDTVVKRYDERLQKAEEERFFLRHRANERRETRRPDDTKALRLILAALKLGGIRVA